MASAESTNHELNTDNSQELKPGVKMPSVATVTDGALKNNDGKANFWMCQKCPWEKSGVVWKWVGLLTNLFWV